jgi:hypothetical protein
MGNLAVSEKELESFILRVYDYCGSVETMEYYNEIGQSVDVVCYASE